MPRGCVAVPASGIVKFALAFPRCSGIFPRKMKSQAWPFVTPLLLFMVFLSVESFFPNQHYALYPIKTLLVVAILAWYWRALPPLTPTAPMLSVAVGIIGIILWIGLDPWAMRLNVLLEELFNRAVSSLGLDSWCLSLDTVHPIGRNPFALYPPIYAWTLFAFRLLGISLVVPVMEELFWRGFLMRWLIRDDFASVPLGTYQPVSFCVTTACFASVHGPEWPLAVVVGIIYGIWFVRTKGLGNVMLAHGVTNLLLALYCLITNDWHFLSIVSPASALR
jgi:membrane protease YdiL (CAAX protease family)